MFVVEHLDNAAIDNIIVSLFYREYNYNDLLNNNLVSNDYVIYLQEFIKEDILNRMNNNVSIRKKIIMRLKEILLYCDPDILLDDDICYFYDRFIRLLGGVLLNVNSTTVYNSYNNNNINRELSYINGLNGDKTNIIINKWLNLDYIDNGNMKLLCKNTILNYPNYFVIKVNNGCDITKNIIINGNKWLFRSAICYSDYYFCLLFDGKKYILYDNRRVPCMSDILISDDLVINKIKKHVVLLIYLKKN